jgi:hypothetical protein
MASQFGARKEHVTRFENVCIHNERCKLQIHSSGNQNSNIAARIKANKLTPTEFMSKAEHLTQEPLQNTPHENGS